MILVGMEKIPHTPDWFHRAQRRIAALTLALGAIAAVIVAITATWRWGIGILIGAALAWINFLWLEQGLSAISKLSPSPIRRAQAAHLIVGLDKSL